MFIIRFRLCMYLTTVLKQPHFHTLSFPPSFLPSLLPSFHHSQPQMILPRLLLPPKPLSLSLLPIIMIIINPFPNLLPTTIIIKRFQKFPFSPFPNPLEFRRASYFHERFSVRISYGFRYVSERRERVGEEVSEWVAEGGEGAFLGG